MKETIIKASLEEVKALAELIRHLRGIPTRHRHILAGLDAPAYNQLLRLEAEAIALAARLEKLI